MKISGDKKGLIFGATLSVVLIIAVPAYAATEASGFPWAAWITGLVNLAILIGIVVKFGGKAIQDYFATRRENFLADMNAAKKAREEAEARLEELNDRLESLENERQGLLDEYHAQGEREKQRLVDTAKKQVERMRVDAKAAINQEVKKAVAMLQGQAVDLAIEAAHKKAVARLDAEAQEKLFDDYMGRMRGPESSVN